MHNKYLRLHTTQPCNCGPYPCSLVEFNCCHWHGALMSAVVTPQHLKHHRASCQSHARTSPAVCFFWSSLRLCTTHKGADTLYATAAPLRCQPSKMQQAIAAGMAEVQARHIHAHISNTAVHAVTDQSHNQTVQYLLLSYLQTPRRFLLKTSRQGC